MLKQQRGMGGDGVWKVELDRARRDRARVSTRRGSAAGATALDEFLARCEPYFAAGGLMVEQPFQARLAEGMIRVYLTHDQVVGFAHQYPRGLCRPGAASRPPAKVFEPPTAAALPATSATGWRRSGFRELQQLPRLDTHALPGDLGRRLPLRAEDGAGEDTYVLCEINASSTFAFPEHAMPTVAEAALRQLAARVD